MLTIEIQGNEIFNEETYEIITVPPCTLQMEHSLVSISKWESKWEKPFLGKNQRTDEELLDYFRCMTITKNVPDSVFTTLNKSNIDKIVEYINKPMTATTFSKDNRRPSHEIITSELIYYWMIECNIPSVYERWHINRLLTLIKVCSVKNEKPTKIPKNQIASQNASLNAARRKAMNSKG